MLAVSLDDNPRNAKPHTLSQIRGGTPLASDPRVGSSLDSLLAGCGRGRLLGPATTGLLAATQLAVLLSNVHRVRETVGVG